MATTQALARSCDELAREALELPAPERLALVGRLLDSLDADSTDPGPAPELIRELRRRREAYRADPSRLVDWDQAYAGLVQPRVAR